MPRQPITLLAISCLIFSCGEPRNGAGPQVQSNSPYAGKELVWADEFDGNSVDTTKWEFLIGTGYAGSEDSGWGNNEQQYYQAENSTIRDGVLVIEAREEEVGGKQYTSSRLTTNDRKEFTFGRVDFRAKLPSGQGIWPALWALGAEFPEGDNWPHAGEIDIMEVLGHETSTLYGTAHLGRKWNDKLIIGDTLFLEDGQSMTDDFNVYSIDWRKDTISWFFNDEKFHEVTTSDIGDQPWPFNDPQYLLINLAVGGNWPGNVDSTTVFPQELLVDYVRVYQ